MKKWNIWAVAAAMSAGAVMPGAVLANDYPSRTVTIIIPYSGGGSTDLLARALANELSGMWNQTVIVENRPGAGSMIGTAYLSQAAPDGYTLLVNTAAHSTAPAVQHNLPFDPQTDITPIGMVATSPYIAVGGAAVQANNFEEFVAEAQERPMFFATAGVGSSSHFSAELLIQQADLPGDVVHFSGGGEAQTNLMGGHADVYISVTASVMPYVNNGQVKPIVILGENRYSLLPDVQSSAELGVSGIEIDGWVGLFGPGGMDPELVERLNADLQTALASDSFRQILAANYVDPGFGTPAEFREQVEAEMELWRNLAEERSIIAN